MPQKSKYTKAEQETSIVWDEDAKEAVVYTASPITLRKLEKLNAEFPDVYRLHSESEKDGWKRYAVPAKYIRFGKPPSEARKAVARRLAEHLRKSGDE